MVGNRLTQTLKGSASTQYGYLTNSNVLSSITSGGQTTQVSTSPAGNTVALTPPSGMATALSFNQAERLSAVTAGGNLVATYAYDAFGRRFSKTLPTTQALYQYDSAGHLLEEGNGNGGPTTDTIYLNGIPVADVTPATMYFLHTDRLGTPQVATTTQAAVAWQAAYQPFGINTGAKGLFTQNLRFPGQYADGETGFHQNGFRDYNPAWGRYIESDPIGLAGGVNTFGYARGNPWANYDTLGLVVPFPIQDLPSGHMEIPGGNETAMEGLSNITSQAGNLVGDINLMFPKLDVPGLTGLDVYAHLSMCAYYRYKTKRSRVNGLGNWNI